MSAGDGAVAGAAEARRRPTRLETSVSKSAGDARTDTPTRLTTAPKNDANATRERPSSWSDAVRPFDDAPPPLQSRHPSLEDLVARGVERRVNRDILAARRPSLDDDAKRMASSGRKERRAARREPPKAPPRLEVYLLSAKGLPKMDVLGRCDAYVKVRIEDGPAQKSRTVLLSYNPIFVKKFVFDVPPKSERLRLEVWDYDLFGSNEFVGNCEVQLALAHKPGVIEKDLCNKQSRRKGNKQSRRKDNGRIRLRIRWIEDGDGGDGSSSAHLSDAAALDGAGSVRSSALDGAGSTRELETLDTSSSRSLSPALEPWNCEQCGCEDNCNEACDACDVSRHAKRRNSLAKSLWGCLFFNVRPHSPGEAAKDPAKRYSAAMLGSAPLAHGASQRTLESTGTADLDYKSRRKSSGPESRYESRASGSNGDLRASGGDFRDDAAAARSPVAAQAKPRSPSLLAARVPKVHATAVLGSDEYYVALDEKSLTAPRAGSAAYFEERAKDFKRRSRASRGSMSDVAESARGRYGADVDADRDDDSPTLQQQAEDRPTTLQQQAERRRSQAASQPSAASRPSLDNSLRNPRPSLDNSLRAGQRPSLDNSLRAPRPSLDNSLQSRPSLDNSLRAPRPSIDNSLRGALRPSLDDSLRNPRPSLDDSLPAGPNNPRPRRRSRGSLEGTLSSHVVETPHQMRESFSRFASGN
ncbi:hypothetical protein M885DRAFT_505333 [Pelagophyceae sp. CCMP2097]|nr:hypothetical protein M885DRAFT_505333 [Pelagophyceae sp. CCMP2097]